MELVIIVVSIISFTGIVWLTGRPKIVVNVTLQAPEKPEIPEIPAEYWDGPTPSPVQREKNLQGIFKIIEEYPNGHLASNNPEYVEEYLNRIDLDLPPGITTNTEPE